MADEITHDAPMQKHHFAIKLPDSTVLGFNVGAVDRDGNFTPDISRMSEQQIDRTALKTSTGQSKYSDFELPYMSIVQDDWSGGRGAKNFEDDTTRFADSWMVRTDLTGKAYLGPRGNYTYGFRDLDQVQPYLDFYWQPLYGAHLGFATPFTAGASNGAYTGEVWLRKVGTPGTLTASLRADSTSLPGALLAADAKDTLAASAVTDTLSFLHSFTWDAVQTLTATTDYWMALVAAATDDENNHWEVGYGETNGAKSVDGTTWTADTVSPFIRVLDGTYDFRPIFFEYKRGLYMVRTDREDGGHAILYINGDRGAADANTGALGTLVDATKSWVTDEFFGATVILIEGPGSEEAQPWRRVVGNNGTSLDVYPDWQVEHTTATSYVILESDKWRIVDMGTLETDLNGDLETQVTDVAVAGDFVYFARGETNSKKVLRYEAYNNAGVWTERNAAEDFSALYLQAIRHPTEGVVLYGACNNRKDGTDDWGVKRIWKGNVPRVWGKLYRSIGVIDDLSTPWDARDISNVLQYTNSEATLTQIAAGHSTGIVAVKDFATPVDLRSGKYISFYIRSSVATDDDPVIDLQLLLSDQPNLGRSVVPNYIFHWTSGTTFDDLELARDGDAATEEILTLTTAQYLYICGNTRFDTITWDLGTMPNAVVATMAAEYFNGNAWVSTALSDTHTGGTSVGGVTLAVDGTMTFAAGWDWVASTVNSQTGYWIRLRPSANLTASVTVKEIKIERATNVALTIPALTANVLTLVRLAISPTAISDIDYSSLQSMAIKLNTDLGAQDIYIAYGVELVKQYLDYVVMPGDQLITGLRAYSGNAADPYNNPWVFADSAVYEIQTQNSDALVELPIGEIKELASENTGKARTVNDVYMYFSLGPEKVERYYGRNLDDIGPDLDEGLPQERRGKPSAMLSYPGRVFLANDAGNSGYSSILMYKGSGWHEVWRTERDGQRILSLYHQVIPGSVMGRLWTNAGAEIVWIPFTLSDSIPSGDTQSGMRYFHEGTLETAWIYGNMVDVVKQWSTVKLFLEEISAGYEFIKADYKVDNDTSWTEIGTTFDTEPSEEASFSAATPPNLSARKIKLRFRFQGSGDATPVLTAMLIEAYGVTPVKYRWVLPCVLSEVITVNLNEEQDSILGNYTAVETAVAKLREAVDNGYACTLTGQLSHITNKTVIVASAVSRPLKVSHNDQPPLEEHLFQIVLDQR